MSPVATLDGGSLWSLMRAAAGGSRAGLAAAVARQCESGSRPRLGWICPPPWPAVERRVAAIHAACGLPAARLAPLTTGGWSFAATAICETVPQAAPAGLAAPMDCLDPVVIRRALDAGDGAPLSFLAVSASGSTLETRQLAGVVAKPLVWLRDDEAPPAVFALSVLGVPDQVAMLGAPLSTAFLAVAAAADAAGLAQAYARLLERHDQIGAAAAARAAQVAADGDPLIHLLAPRWAGPGLRLWLLQLARQVVCGKSGQFRPWIEVVGPGESRVTPDVLVDLAPPEQGLPGLMETLYGAGIFAGALALRAGLAVAEHSRVAAYKERLSDARLGTDDLRMVNAADLPAVAEGWLAARPELTRLHVVRYESGPGVSAEQFTVATGRSCEVHAGSAWNHHSFHAVHADRSVAVLLVVASRQASEEVAEPLLEAARTQRLIAVATHLALAGRSLIVQLPAGGRDA